MTLEEANTIDIITKPKNGKMMMVITDAGVTTDPQERLEKLIAKLRSYVGYIMSDNFKKEYPGVKPKNVTIKVICQNEPTEQMKQIDKVMPHGDRENMIPIKYELFKD
jgi:hypothetical protein